MSASNASAHTGKTVRCTGVLTDEDGEPITKTQTIDGDRHSGEPPREVEVEQHCDTKLIFEDHGRFERHLKDERRERFEQCALVFTCPDCGEQTAICPVCSEQDDSDDNSPAGYFRGDSTNEQIPCHNCNQQEIAERQRHHGHSGTMGSRRRRGNGDESLTAEDFL